MPARKRHVGAPISGSPDANPVNRTGQAKSAKRDDAFAARLHLALDGRSQAWLAEQTDLSKSTVNDYAKGAIPSADRAFLLARTLGVSAEWLITGSHPDDPQWGSLDEPLLAKLTHADLMNGLDAPLRARIRKRSSPIMEYVYLDQGHDFRFLFLTSMPEGGFADIANDGAFIMCARAAVLTPGAYYLVRVEDRIEIRRLMEADGRNALVSARPGAEPIDALPLDQRDKPPFIVAWVVGTPLALL